MPLYAGAEIAEALIFNLPANQLEYYSQPEAGVYQSQQVLSRGHRFESVNVPGLTLQIDTILG